MTASELLKEALKDPLLKEKYDIPESELKNVSFTTHSNYPIIETIKTIVLKKSQNFSDPQVYRDIKLMFNIQD